MMIDDDDDDDIWCWWRWWSSSSLLRFDFTERSSLSSTRPVQWDCSTKGTYRSHASSFMIISLSGIFIIITIIFTQICLSVQEGQRGLSGQVCWPSPLSHLISWPSPMLCYHRVFVDMMWYKAFSVYLVLRHGMNVLFQVRYLTVR